MSMNISRIIDSYSSMQTGSSNSRLSRAQEQKDMESIYNNRINQNTKDNTVAKNDVKTPNVMNIYNISQNQNSALRDRISKVEDTQDVVSISSQARDYQVAYKALMSASAQDIRADKVASIKERIENDTYNVSSDDVADAILKKVFQ